MRVAIDGLNLFGHYTGIQWSLARLVMALRREYPDDEIVLYVPRDFSGPPAAEDGRGLQLRRTWFPGRWRTVRTLWRNFRLQNRTYAQRCELLHGPTYALPIMLAKPGVVTIHDCIALTHPLFCTPGSARVQVRIIPHSAKVARRVIVPSQTTKNELLRTVPEVAPEKIDVVPWGVGPEFAPLTAGREEARAALHLPERYVLFVGNLEPKKNIPLLLQAFFAAKLHRKLPHKLVLAGQVGWGMRNLGKLIRDLNAREFVLFTGFIPQAALPAVYSLADLLVLPSTVEGFGLPALEAMACACPVVISEAAALREVCGDAARVAPYGGDKPLQPLREAIEELLLASSGARAEWVRRGVAQAKLFTWEQTARLTRQTYEKALG